MNPLDITHHVEKYLSVGGSLEQLEAIFGEHISVGEHGMFADTSQTRKRISAMLDVMNRNGHMQPALAGDGRFERTATGVWAVRGYFLKPGEIISVNRFTKKGLDPVVVGSIIQHKRALSLATIGPEPTQEQIRQHSLGFAQLPGSGTRDDVLAALVEWLGASQQYEAAEFDCERIIDHAYTQSCLPGVLALRAPRLAIRSIAITCRVPSRRPPRDRPMNEV